MNKILTFIVIFYTISISNCGTITSEDSSETSKSVYSAVSTIMGTSENTRQHHKSTLDIPTIGLPTTNVLNKNAVEGTFHNSPLVPGPCSSRGCSHEANINTANVESRSQNTAHLAGAEFSNINSRNPYPYNAQPNINTADYNSNSGQHSFGYGHEGSSHNSHGQSSGDYLRGGNTNTEYSHTGHANTGYSNSNYGTHGYSNEKQTNTGYPNTGFRNTGYGNTGYGNTGYGNTGSENAGYSNTGFGNPTNPPTNGYSNFGHGHNGYSNSGQYNTGFHHNHYPNHAQGNNNGYPYPADNYNHRYEGDRSYSTFDHRLKTNTEYKEVGHHVGTSYNNGQGFGSGFGGTYNGAFNRPGF
ncbi:uncharacterized PPE family protein PPE21 [Teleopsis dalmanni]|uniref:uncharacterized PPE family protein PPE21 n=1 Tax=Teleopsis dalmanni TaxID=139649 RepID=UPI0018CC9507|nr:uncharacterized PPE family protein PPE21 [Teleopsis dalmanni]